MGKMPEMSCEVYLFPNASKTLPDGDPGWCRMPQIDKNE